MARDDGRIRISTEISTKSAQVQLAVLENRIVKTADTVNSLRSKLNSLENVKIPTQEYKDLQNELSKAEKEMEKMVEQDKKLADVDAKIKKLTQSYEQYAAKIKEAESTSIPTQNYKDCQSELDELLKKQKQLNEEIKEFDNVRGKEKIPLYQDLYFQLEGVNKNIEHTTELMKFMEDEGKAFTSSIDASKIEKLKAKQEAVNQELEKQKAIHSEIAQKQADSVQKVFELKGQIKQLVEEGKAFKLGSETEEYTKLLQQLEYAENDLSVLNQKHELLELKQKRNIDSYKRLGDTAKKALTSVGNMLKKINSLVDSFAKRIKTAFSNLGKSASTANKGFSGISLSLKNILKYGFGIRSLYVLVNKLRSALAEGFGNLLDYSESLENSINGIKATALTLKNAFAAAFSPFVEIALPYVQTLLDYMIQLVNIAGQFFAAITGRTSYIRAIKQTTAAIEEETAAMNKQLSPLDKLNNLTSQESKGANTGTGGTMFEEVPIDDSILDVAEKIKDILSRLFEPLKKAWEQEGQFVMDSWKYALEEVWKLIKDIGKDFLTVWNEDETVAILANILHIIGDIGLVVGNLARNFREAWNENEVGLNILRNIRDIIGIIVQHIRNMADATVEWADKLDFYPLLDAFNRFLDSLKPVVDAIWGILEDFYTYVLLPLGKWVLEEGLPELLQVFIDFNKKVDWESLRQNLAEFWEHLEPFAETVGEGLIIFINRVADALANFLNSQEFKDFLVTVEEWMDSVTPEDVADALESIAKGLIALKLALLGFSAISAITGVLTTIKTFLSFFGVGGGAAGAGAAMESTAASAGVLSTALGDLATAIAGVGVFDVAIKNPLFDLMEAMGADADRVDLMREKYGEFGGTIDIVKDTFSVFKNSLQGYGAVISDTSELSKALEIAMEDIANGAILSDEHMAQLKERFGATNDDLEMLRQEMLDTNPQLRELADNFGLFDASAETLKQISGGMSLIEQGIYDADDAVTNFKGSFPVMTDEAKAFFKSLADGVTPVGQSIDDVSASMENFSTSISEATNEAVTAFSSTAESMAAASEDMVDVATQTGQYIAEEIAEGMMLPQAELGIAAGNLFNSVLESFNTAAGIHSPADNMMPSGENVTLGILEGFKSQFDAFTAPIQQLITQISSKFTGGLQSVKNIWTNAWNSFPSIVTNVINIILSKISSLLSSLSNTFSSIKSKMSSTLSGGFGSALGSAFKNYSLDSGIQVPVSPVYAALSNVEIPAYATGQVIPRTMKQHLAILGDNTRETEVVSPISTIEQALENVLSRNNGGGGDINLNLTVECEGYQLLQVMQKLDREYFKQTGRHAFA